MKRYIVYKNDQILQILQNPPLFTPTHTSIAEYDGLAPNHLLRIVDGNIVEDEEPQCEAPPVFSPELQQYKTDIIEKINNHVEDLRTSSNHQPFSQPEIYFEKTTEAIDYAAAGYPESLDGYPFISMEMEISGLSGKQVTDQIFHKRKQWIHTAVQTEKIRKIFTRKIHDCKTIAEVDIIFQTFTEQAKLY